MNYDMSHFKLGAKWSIGNTILKTLVSVFITYLVVKELSVKDYGIFNLLIVIVSYLQLVVVPGLLQVIRRFIPEFVQQKDFYGVHYFIKSYSFNVLLIAILSQVLLFVFSQEIGDFFSIDELWNKLKFLFFFIPFYFLDLIFNQLFNSLLFQKYLALINFSTEIIRGSIIIFLFSFKGIALEWVLLAQGTAWFFSAIFFIIIYYQYYYKRNISNFIVKAYDKKRFRSYGIYTYFNEIGAKILNVSTDYFIIGAYLGPLSIGYYAFANKVVTIVGNLLPNRMIKAPLTAYFYNAYSKDKSFVILQDRFNLILKLNLICVAPIVFSIIGFGNFFIQLIFDSKYDGAIVIVYILAAFMATKTITHPLGLVLTALEDVKIILYSKLLSFINIIAAIILVNYFQEVGVAFATCFSVLMKDMIIFFYARHKYKLGLPIIAVTNVILISSLIAVVGYLMSFLTINSIAVLLSLLGVFLLCYYLIFKIVLKPYEISLIKDMVLKR